MRFKFLLSIISFHVLVFQLFAQTTETTQGSVHGNFQIDGQYYNPDSLIGAPKVSEHWLSNAYGSILYTQQKFSAGIRYEAYNNVMQGFDSRYKGQGITNRFARYRDDLLDITIGNIYEQFGNGLILRTYYEPGLLYDNALDGISIISNPLKGITLKGLMGKQRSFFTMGSGIVRGVDGEFALNDLLDSLMTNWNTRVNLGFSFVSKFQADEDPDFILPENVGAYSGRIQVNSGDFVFTGEYAQKENDPSATNKVQVGGKTYYSYKKGEALFLSSSYAKNGFSLLLQAKRIDNMDFRSDRNAGLQNLLINYLPATTRQHTYLMLAFNPYATQPLGEAGGMAELQYKFKKGSLLGGAYGTDITFNYSYAAGLKKQHVNDSATHLTLYKTSYAEIGKEYYHDFFVEINKKFSAQWKGTFLYANQFYNRNMVQFGSPFAGYQDISADIFVADVTWKYKSGSALRMEAQAFITKNKSNPNAGSWATGLVEWTPQRHFFIAVLDQYNYSNPDASKITSTFKQNAVTELLDITGLDSWRGQLNLHYFLLSTGYTKGAHRIALNFGKQRAGIFCVGGVCRNVPASNGISISITSSF